MKGCITCKEDKCWFLRIHPGADSTCDIHGKPIRNKECPDYITMEDYFKKTPEERYGRMRDDQ